MALIKCIDCGKDVSDRASSCPNCGCPIEDSKQYIMNAEILSRYSNEITNLRKTYRCSNCGGHFFTVKLFAGILMSVCLKCSNHEQILIYNRIELNDWRANRQNIAKPHCPYCNSTNLKKIGVGSRMISAGTLGLAGSKIGKQWHCNNCKSDF